MQAGAVVVFVTRTGAGRVVLSDAQREAGILSGGDLDGLKARILLTVALGAGRNAEEIGAAFRRLSGAG